MSQLDREDENAYRLNLLRLSDDDLRKEIWLLDEHIRYLQREDDQTVVKVLDLLQLALEEKDRRALNKGYM